MSLNGELSAIFRTMAAVLDIKGENAFKAIAFSKVSRILGDMTVDVRDAVERGTLKDVQGIGESSRKIIEEYVRTGRSSDHESLTTSMPAGLLPMLDIPGLGPKTIAVLWKQRGVTSLDELVRAIDEGRLAGLKGIGEKKIDAIKQGIRIKSQSAGRVGIAEALPIATAILERLRKVRHVREVEVAGSLRRRRETIGDVDIVCALRDHSDSTGTTVTAAFVAFPEVTNILGQGPTKASVMVAGGVQVDLRVVPVECYGAALLYFTGSKDHNVKLRGRAQDMGMTLNEWGLYDLKKHEKAEKTTGEPRRLAALACRTEADVYATLGLAYVEPELREDRGEVEAAAEKRLPSPLITIAHIRGDLHTHTTASDGTGTIEQMAEAALARGYAFLAITDHSKSQVIANGLTAERLAKHAAAIRKAGDKIKGIRLLAGCEVDILVDGRLDFDEAVLKELDIVVASPHVSLKQDPQKATDRIRRAVETRYVNIIGHPTGRLIGGREGLPVDFSKVFPIAAASGTALEINAGYPRLDLNEINARAAIEAGCMLSINTDAHSPDSFDEIVYGVGVARRAWAAPANVINCMSADELMAFIARKR